MSALQIKNTLFTHTDPKICVPLVGNNLSAILSELDEARDTNPDLLEWRADYMDDLSPENIAATRNAIQTVFPSLPLLFTLRAENEGGRKSMSPDERLQCILEAFSTGPIDMADIEGSSGVSFISHVMEAARKHNTAMILSYHNFTETPPEDELLTILMKLHSCGADIVKAACMPRQPQDVLAVAGALLRYREKTGGSPAIGIAMGDLGRISRIAAGFFGSCITYASLRSASAPGQLSVKELRTGLTLMRSRANT